ncbi:uncharacterized protein LOC129596257 [Paramacrobiotus metropolitanus]|uniref:uncharacterized protein LOC129596257 n=1 Tax=Paramacrobiotus metropolitanus TaxID=2943436 RepID=UPI002445949F|nr:uncharacterized protein LOC129596257 [Paramacrobiotus metropolitanus]
MNTAVSKRELFSPRLLLFGVLAILCGLSLMILDIVTGTELEREGVYFQVSGLAVRTFAGLIYIVAGNAEIYASRPLHADEKAENRQALLGIVVRLNLLAALASLTLLIAVMSFEPYYDSGLMFREYRSPDIVSTLTTLRMAVICCLIGIVLVCSITECVLAHIYAKKPNIIIITSNQDRILESSENLVVRDVVEEDCGDNQSKHNY